MIRPFTFITMLLAATSGAYLFAVKHRAQVLDDKLAQVADESRQDAQRIRVLQAQWALETDPTRLQELAARFTTLQPMKPAQLVTFAALQTMLPPAGMPPPGAAPANGGGPSIQVHGAAVAPVTMASALPLPPSPAPAPPAQNFASVEAVVHALRASGPSELHLASARDVVDLPPPRPAYVPPRHPVYAPSLPIGAAVMSVKAMSPPPDDGGSLLGMATNMPPPSSNYAAPPQPLAPNGSDN
jgi:hypothetical protein